MKAVLGSVLRLDRSSKSTSVALLKGSFIHKVLENVLEGIKARTVTDIAAEIAKQFTAIMLDYKNRLSKYQPETIQKLSKFVDSSSEIQKMLSEHVTEAFYVPYQTKDVYFKTEKPFYKATVLGQPFDGRIDVIFDFSVTDFKTTSKNMLNSKDPDKAAAVRAKLRRECGMQLLVYKEALREQIPAEHYTNLKKYHIVEFVLTKNPVINTHTFDSDELDAYAEELSDRIKAAKEILIKKSIQRNYRSSICPCEYSEYCLNEDALKIALSTLDAPKDTF